MASTTVRGGLECSSSGRGTTKIFASLRQSRISARPLPHTPVPALRVASAPSRPSADHVPQPPHRRRTVRQQLQPLRVLPEPIAVPQTQAEVEAYVASLNKTWGIPEAVEFGIGQGGLPTVLLTHPQTGMQLVVYLYGATIAQWIKSDATATFHDGPDQLYQLGMPLRTGVSVHFPQHREGLLPEHGFADSMMWEVAGAGVDNLEMIQQMAEYWKILQLTGLDPDLLEKALDDEEAAAKVRELLADVPPPDNLVDTDIGPCITLRLRDTPETRKMWPHQFELEYKITLQTQDIVTEEDWAEIRRSRGISDEQHAAELAAEEAEEGEVEVPDEVVDMFLKLVQSGRVEAMGTGEEEEAAKEGAEEKGTAAEGAGEEGQGEEEEAEEEEEEEGEKQGEEAAAAAAAGKKRGRLPRQAAAAASGAGEGEEGEGGAAAEKEGEEEEEEEAEEEEGVASDDRENERPMGQDPFRPTVQIKQEFWLRNKDEPGSAPMRFNLASLSRFVTLQQPQYSDWVKILGLGGSQTFDYTEDPRHPRLDMCEEDFIHYNGEARDVTYINAADATLYLCPGNRTHFEFIQRAGFRDMFIQQPALAAAPDYQRVACVGTGYVATTKELPAGEEWHAESVIRFHNRYFPLPVFGDDSMPPLPPIARELLSERSEVEGYGASEDGGGDDYEGPGGDE